MDEGTSTTAQVQRRVVGVVTQVPGGLLFKVDIASITDVNNKLNNTND